MSVLSTYHVGDDEVRGTPVTMPNTEVKPYVAEDTLENKSRGKYEVANFFYIILNSSVVEHSAVNRRVVGSSPTWGARE